MTVANVQVTQVLLKRGNTTKSLAYTGPLGEPTMDTDLKSIRIHDGVTPGGYLIGGGGGTYGNANVAVYLSSNADPTVGNLTANTKQQQVQINAINSNVQTLSANVGGFYTWANSNFSTSSYSNANVAAYLPGYTGLIGGTITTGTQTNINQLGVLNSLNTAGDVAISGNLTVTGNINFIGNVTNQTVTGNSGQFFGDSHGFGALYAGISSGYTVQPQIAVQVSTNYNDYGGINMQNINSGARASSDLIITADNGNASDTFIDIGIGSSTYNYPGYAIARPNDAYINVFGNAVTGGGNLIINTQTANDILFVVGGSNVNNEVMRITAGNVVRINSTNISTSATSGALIVAGGVGVSGTVTVANTVVVQGIDLVANAATQADAIVSLDLKIIAANSYAINNVTGANAAIQLLSANVGSYYVWANANVAGLQSQITGANVAWQANAATQAVQIQTLNANIGSYYIYANNAQSGQNVWLSNLQANVTSINANIGSYYIWANANVSGLQSQITGANATIQALSANVGGFYTYANATFATTGSVYGNANVATYLPTYSGNITATNIATDNLRFANGAPLSFSALVNGAYTATLSSGGVFQANAIQSDGVITTQGPVVLTYSGVNNTLYKIAAVDVDNLAIYGTRNTYFDTTLLTLNSASGNVTAVGNVVAPNYLFANGVNILSTVGAGSYGNTQVAQFLPTYTGNVSAGNASVTNQFTVPFGAGQTATDIQRIILAQTLIA